MEKLREHRINVGILPAGRVQINSEFIDKTYPRSNGVTTDEFTSVTDAKKKLSSLYKLYERFNTAYNPLLIVQAGGLMVNLGKGVGDLVTHFEAFGDDILRGMGIIVIGIITLVAKDTAKENKVKTSNKLSAVKETQESGEWHYRNVYPF